MRHQRSTTPAASRVSHNRYPTAPDGRGASTVTRAKPVGKDPLAVSEGLNDTAASQEYLKAQRERLAKEST
jgi:hypothetical protein